MRLNMLLLSVESVSSYWLSIERWPPWPQISPPCVSFTTLSLCARCLLAQSAAERFSGWEFPCFLSSSSQPSLWLSSSRFNRSWFCELHEPQIGKLFFPIWPQCPFSSGASRDVIGHQMLHNGKEGRKCCLAHKSQESLFIISVIIDGMSEVKWQWIAGPVRVSH